MSKTVCPITIGLDKDEKFQELKKVYADRKLSDYELLMALQGYREEEDLSPDWYPETKEDYRGFTNYLDKPSAKPSESTVSLESLNELYRAITTLYDSPAVLNNRVDRITSLFVDYVNNLVKKSSFGVTRQQAIERQGTQSKNGFNVILEKVFDYINSLSTLKSQRAWYARTYPTAGNVDSPEVQKFLQHRADEFKKMYDNKESLATLASVKIGAKEGFTINIDGMQYDFADIEGQEEEVSQEDSEKGIDSGEAMKGDRYDDVRTHSLMSTLSTEARQMLDNIWVVDKNGNVVRDDLGFPVRVNEKQAVVSLHKILRASTPESMMTDMQQATSRYPWLRSLVNYLNNNPDARTIVYCNFKKARSTYYYGKKSNDGKLSVRPINNVADGKGLSREAGINIGSGTVAGEQYHFVNGEGKLSGKDNVAIVRTVLEGYAKKLHTQFAVKPVASEAAKSNWTTDNAAEYWRNLINDTPVSEFEELTKVLRGIGFSLEVSDVKYALANAAPIASISGTRYDKNNKNKSVTNQVSSLERLVNNLKDLCSRTDYILDSGEDLTGTHLYNYAQDVYSNIADILSVIQSTEVEERSISRSKSLAAAVTPNAIHELVDKLSNVANLSDEEYRQMIMDDYGQYEGMSLGFGDNMQLTGWLADLYNDGNVGSDASYKMKRKAFQIVDFTDLTINTAKDFAKMTDAEHAMNSYVMYTRGLDSRTNKSENRFYEVPIQADYETAYNFISAPRYEYLELVDKLALEVECEAQRITAILERQANDPKEKGADPVRGKADVYEKRGILFQIFPEMNTNGFRERYAAITDPALAHEEVKKEVNVCLRNMLESEKTKLAEMGLFKRDNLKVMGIKTREDKSLADWILNSFYARQQMTKLLYGGLEHFKSTTDFEKRNMYAHATRLPLYTKATYRSENVGKENQRVLYLSDDVVKSSVYDNIVRIADRLYNEKKITVEQRDYMKEAYKEITTTDGQGLRTLDSMREVKIMASTWTDADEVAYQNIKNKRYNSNDVAHFMVGIKPVYTGYEVLPAQDGKFQKPVRVPVLHKYSEMVLLPEMLEGIDGQSSTSPLKALNKLNDSLGEGNKIDLFLFGSGVKVGAGSVLDPFAKNEDGSRILKSANDIESFLEGKVKNADFWVHTLPYKYYGITSAMHADVVDKKIAWATQAEKEAWGNILSSEELVVGDKRMKSTDARELFYKIKAARTVDTFRKLNDRLSDKTEVARLLKEEIATKPYQSRELLFALQMRDNGKFSYPLYSPSVQHDVIALLSSVVKKQFTKVGTKGANMTQTTSFGMDMESDLTGFDETMADAGFEPLEVKFDENGKFRYVETYLPITDSRLEQFADRNGNITPKRLRELVKGGYISEGILNFIAYRTPSDAEHSVIPCWIKGFMSNVSGPSIRMPREIMKMTGHDYDGDKMRCHFKEFYLGWNEDLLRKDFEKFSDSETIQKILNSKEDATLTPYEVFKRNAKAGVDADKYRAVKEIKYDYDKAPVDNIGKNGDYSALNNALVDLMFAQLTSEAGGLKMFIPGGAEETKQYANTIGTREKFNGSVVSPFTVSHATESHAYMMEGAGMIGVYAVYNSSAAMFQRLNLQYVPNIDGEETIPVILFGKAIDKLFEVKSNGQFATLAMSRLLNAAVDNGKEPLLGYLNQTEGLAHLTNFILAAGYSEEQMHILMNQPVMKAVAQDIKATGASFAEVATAINNNLIAKLAKIGGKEKYTQKESVQNMARLSAETLLGNVQKNFSDIMQSGTVSELEQQLYVLQTMKHLNPAARDLQEFTMLCRPESNSGSLDSTIGGTIARLIQLDKFRERMYSKNQKDVLRISGVFDVLDYRPIYENSMTNQMIMVEIGNELPEVVALNAMMKDSILKIFRLYFPQAKESWLSITKRIADKYSYDKLPPSVVERITNDMILWKLLSDTAFITGNPQQEQERIVKNVPEQLRKLKKRIETAKENPGNDTAADKLRDNLFLANLDLGTTLNAENETISRIRFQLNGASIEDTADTIRAAWAQMLYSSDPEIKQLATDLFKYNLYTNGFSYGRYEFAHFAPAAVLFSTSGYMKALNSVLTSDWAKDDEDNFYNQYMMNHWGDKNLLQRFNPDKLPLWLRANLGFTATVKSPVKPEKFNEQLADADYFILRTEKNGKKTDHLYRIFRNEATNEIASVQEMPKLGIRNRNNQVMVQYNPRVRDYGEMKPTFVSNEVTWEGRYSSVDGDTISDDVDEQEVARQNAIDEIDFDWGLVKASSPEQFAKLQEETGKAPAIQTDESGKLSAEQAAALGFTDEEFYIVNRDENGNIVSGYFKATPEVVEKAREQAAFHALNESLISILAEHGVGVGQLYAAEARLGAGGVTDFATPKVLANGLIEYIRLSNNQQEAEYALPEEFAHIAIEMLGKHTVERDDAGNIISFHHDNALVSRLLNQLNRDTAAMEEAYNGQLGKYEELYGNDKEKLVLEAAGKLVSKHLFLRQYIKTPSTRTLVQRVCDAIRAFFKNFSIDKIRSAIFGADKVASTLARDLLSGRLADELKKENITRNDKFYQLDKDISEKSDIISKMIEYTVKRQDYIQRRLKYSLGKGATSRSLDATRAQLAKLTQKAENQKLELTVTDYLKDTLDFMKETEKSLDEAINTKPANAVCKKLRITRDSLYSFAAVVQDVREAIDKGELEDDVNLRQMLKDVSDTVENFWTKYNRISLDYFEQFLSNVYGEDGVTVTLGRDKGRHISIHEMATKADKDISIAARALNALSDCDDYVLQAVDDVTREAKLNAREEVKRLRPRLESAFAALVKAQGNRNQSWMFERRGGKRTGRYISEAVAKTMIPERYEFYQVFMELKHYADKYMPDTMTDERKMIMFRKEHYEKMKDAEGINGKTAEVWDNAKRGILEMGDIDYENEEVVKDFEDNIVDSLPVKFLNKGKNETFDDMTEDCATSLMAYLGMACEYHEMNNVIGMLENARYASSMREIGQKRGGRNLFHKAGDEKDFHYKKPYTVKQAKTNIQQAMDDFFQMHVYGHLQKDEGTIGKTRISRRKLTNALTGYTSLAQMALNLHQRIANVNTGLTQIIVESNKYGKIKAKDVAWASAIWTAQSADRMAETGKTDYDNKLSLWMDKFDIHQDNGRENQTIKYGKTDGSRAFNSHLLYAGLSIGEDFLAGTTALAYARNYKMKGPKGEDSNIWDAYEVKYVDAKNKTGAYLALKLGYTKADGSALTFEDEKKFGKQVIAANFEMQGIYNVDDRSAIQQHSLGALAIMYRKWIAPAMKRRYASARYSKLRDEYTEGYYVTALGLAKNAFKTVKEADSEKTVFQILTDIKSMNDAIVLNWDKMTDYEKGNVKKALRELTIVMCLFIASGLLKRMPDDDHDGDKFLAWADDFAVTQLLRLRSEIGSQAPTPNLIKEFGRILSSPFAALGPLKDTLNIFQLLVPSNYIEEVKTGRYAGHKKAYKYFRNLPIVSLFKKLDNVVDPTPLLEFYQNQNY